MDIIRVPLLKLIEIYMMNVCLTHDIDRIDKTYQYFTKPLRALKVRDFDLFFKRLFSFLYVRKPYWGFNYIIEIENQFHVKSTLFFLNESVPFSLFQPSNWKLSMGRYTFQDKRIIDIIKYLDHNGWEIGLHGSYWSYKNHELLKIEKEGLEYILGHPVSGIRQHYLNWEEHTWEIHEKLGFEYDSSWGYRKNIGFKDNKIVPFFPVPGSLFCEIPLVIMDYPFVLIKNKWSRFENICDECESKNAFLVINYHNANLDPLDHPGVMDDYIEIIERLKKRGARFLTMKQAYERVVKFKG